jgi:hypothetical protein
MSASDCAQALEVVSSGDLHAQGFAIRLVLVFGTERATA